MDAVKILVQCPWLLRVAKTKKVIDPAVVLNTEELEDYLKRSTVLEFGKFLMKEGAIASKMKTDEKTGQLVFEAHCYYIDLKELKKMTDNEDISKR